VKCASSCDKYTYSKHNLTLAQEAKLRKVTYSEKIHNAEAII